MTTETIVPCETLDGNDLEMLAFRVFSIVVHVRRRRLLPYTTVCQRLGGLRQEEPTCLGGYAPGPWGVR
jgi:hypothetical protein